MQNVKVSQHLFEYRHEGAEYAIQIPARSREDALARLKVLPWAEYRGEVYSEVAVPSKSVGLIAARISTWFMNIARM
ncbi:MAG: hypothetical protein ABJN69_03075 [Hellea sp.]